MKKTTEKIIYIVGTPIGNLGDISQRALEILNTVDFIVCEDTRHSMKLLSHFNIKKNLVSLHKDNEQQQAEKILASLEGSFALISDAGTPGVSDPGSFLIGKAFEQGISIINIPGPSSLSCAIASSGFQAKHILFMGFLDRKPDLSSLSSLLETGDLILVFFESPKRILNSLTLLKETFPKSLVTVSKEISKLHEQHIRAPIEDALFQLQNNPDSERGEYVISLLIPKKQIPVSMELAVSDVKKLRVLGLKQKDACRFIAEKSGVSQKELYALTYIEDERRDAE